jgi:uncharacterized phage infection (PIP) family protein YhgE
MKIEDKIASIEQTLNMLINSNKNIYTQFDKLESKLDELQIKINELENIKIGVDVYGNQILKQGVEYLSKIIGGEVISEFNWQDADWVKYKIQLDGVTGDWEINIRKPSRQLQIGTTLRHYIIGRKIQIFKIISDE